MRIYHHVPCSVVRRSVRPRRRVGGAILLLAAALTAGAARSEPPASHSQLMLANVPLTGAVPGLLRVRDAAFVTADPTRPPDVIFVPTPHAVVDRMLELARPKKTDLVYDLGCGDGRIVIAAAKRYGVRAVGFDIDPARVAEARENVRKNKVEHLVTIEQRDIFTVDLAPADVVTLYLLPELNVRLIPQLERLKPGARVVSHDFDMRGVVPERVEKVRPPGAGRDHLVYLWRVPLVREEQPTEFPWMDEP